MKDYEWILDQEELRNLEIAKTEQRIRCKNKFNYYTPVNDHSGITIEIKRQSSGTSRAEFIMKFRHFKKRKETQVTLSIFVEEIQWTNRTITVIKQKEYVAWLVFDDNLIDSLESLSLHIAVHIKPLSRY